MELLATTELALPGHMRRMEDFVAAREAVPAGVNERYRNRSVIDERIAKTAADMIVPFERFAEMMEVYRRGFESRQLDYAIWGPFPTATSIPTSFPRASTTWRKAEKPSWNSGAKLRDLAVAAGRAWRRPKCGQARASSPALWRRWNRSDARGQAGMDPDWKLAPGVLFPRRRE